MTSHLNVHLKHCNYADIVLFSLDYCKQFLLLNKLVYIFFVKIFTNKYSTLQKLLKYKIYKI